MAPPGSKILIHTKPSHRSSWTFHGTQGWYIGPALQHYHCVRYYVPTTRSEIVSDTIKFIPEYVYIPTATIDDYIKTTLEHKIRLMKSKKKDNLYEINDTTASSALLQISKLFNNYPSTAPNVSLTKLYPILVTQNVTKKSNTTKNTEGGIESRKKNSSYKQKIKPMSDEEFNRLLKNLKNP